MATGTSAWAARALAVLRKEVRSELRTRTALNALVLFAVTTLTAVSFAVGGVGIGADIRASLFWLILFFAAMAGLSRTFVHEEEAGTVVLLRLSASPNMVLLGKTLFNLALLAFLAVLLTFLFGVMVGLTKVSWPLFLANLGLGIVGLAGSTTILGAIVARASVKGALFSALAFPVILPLLVTVIGGTRLAFQGAPLSEGMGGLQALVSFDGLLTSASFVFFEYVWQD
jgi:heme exporter protein B